MAETTARWTAAEAAAKAAEAEYIDKQIVEEMIESAQLISDGEYSGYCTEDINISSIHTADVAPVRHGKWIYKSSSDIWMCSRCGKGVNADPKGIDLYCYHCGAKMDEKENDDGC